MSVSEVMMIEDNLKQKLRYIASKHHSMKVFDFNGVSIVDSKLSSDTFNTAFGGKIDAQTAKEVFLYFKNIPMAWWVGPSSDTDDARIALRKSGFVHEEVDIGMVCDLTKFSKDYEIPSTFKIRKCRTLQDYKDFGDVLSSGFDPVDEQVKIFYQNMAILSSDETEDMILYVGYENNDPVSCSSLFLTDVAGIYDVVTRSDKRRLGYGSAIFYQTLLEAQARNYSKAVLQASPDGLNLYKSFGFVELCQFNVWSNKQ